MKRGPLLGRKLIDAIVFLALSFMVKTAGDKLEIKLKAYPR